MPDSQRYICGLSGFLYFCHIEVQPRYVSIQHKGGEQHYGNACDPDFDNDGVVSILDFNDLTLIQVNTITFHPVNRDWIYVGTDLGILASEAKGDSGERL